MRRGDILLVRTRGPIGGLIRLLTRCEYNHVAMAVSPVAIFESTFPGGVRIAEMEYKDYMIYRHPLISEKIADRLINTALFKVGAEYDLPFLLQIWAKLWKIGRYRLNSENKYICTEILNYVFDRCGVKLFKRWKKGVTPKDFMESDCFLYKVCEHRRQ